MNKTELKLEYEICENENSGIPVIVVAAGNSTRMKGTNKQLALLGGIPVIIRTLRNFENSKDISNIILVVKDTDLFEFQMLTHKYMITKISDIVCGGNSRQESVLIHDGARPFADEKIINSVVSALNSHSAVTCAVKVKDTVKKIDKDGKVIKTLKRDSLVAVQTPQGVEKEKYLEVVKNVNVADFTDDTSIMEAAGYDVFTVEGSYKNIKITTQEDMISANAFLNQED